MADIKTRTVDKTSIKTMDQSISASHRSEMPVRKSNMLVGKKLILPNKAYLNIQLQDLKMQSTEP